MKAILVMRSRAKRLHDASCWGSLISRGLKGAQVGCDFGAGAFAFACRLQASDEVGQCWGLNNQHRVWGYITLKVS